MHYSMQKDGSTEAIRVRTKFHVTVPALAPLFQPVDVSGLSLRNRFAMAPMTRFQSPDGVPTDAVVEYYRRRASTFGLVISEGTYVDHPLAGGYDDVPHFYGVDALAGWSRVVSAVHEEGAKFFPQLWHLGVRRLSGENDGMMKVASPSGRDLDGGQVGEPLSQAGIDAVIESYVRAAVDAQSIGCDGVELHGAHGYLLDEFLWSATNGRADEYGGSLPARSRLSVEVVSAIRAAVGPDYPICLRFSQWKGGHYDARNFHSPGELAVFVEALTAAGVSIWHPSTRQYWSPAFEESPRTLAGWTRQFSGRPTMAVGSVGVRSPYGARVDSSQISLEDLTPLVDLFEAGEFDLVAIGRAALSDAAWLSKVASGDLSDVRAYLKDHESTLD